jgi:hypothetical protein
MKKISVIILLLACLSLNLPLVQAQVDTPLPTAKPIDYNLLISDSELTDYNSMDQTQIHDFLAANGSFLATFYVDGGFGQPAVSATELIYRAAQDNRINPKFLLVLVQKEQSLITNPNPSQRALDFATGYGCFDGSACQERWRGFGKQVYSAAAQFRYYIDNIDEYNYQPGKTFRICNDYNDACASVTPQNASTAALYVYTPHLHGNELFKSLWDRYFYTSSTFFPDGALLQAKGDPTVWLIQDGKKRGFSTKAALLSRYSESNIQTIASSTLDGIPVGNPIEFAANTLLKSPDGTMYLLTEKTKRKIASPEVFRAIGFNPQEADDATSAQLAAIPDGLDITIKDTYPTGALLQNNKNGGVYYVENGTKYPLWSKDIITVNFPKRKIYPASPTQLATYLDGNPIGFKDGTLLKTAGAPDVYVISNGNKLRITDEKTFNFYGYKWKNIITTSDKVLAIHPDGPALSI